MIITTTNFRRAAVLCLTVLFLASCQLALDSSSASGAENAVTSTSSEFEARALTGAVGTNYPASGPYSAVNRSAWGGAAWPLGAHFVSGEGSNLRIAVYSANATAMLLEIYGSATGQDASYDYWMVKGADNIWRAEIASIPGKTLYAFRAWGPNWPYSASWSRGNSAAGYIADYDGAGNRFNPNKVLYDPYTREMSHDKETPAMIAAGHDGGMYASGSGLYKGIVRRTYDTARWAPKGVALKDTTATGVKPAIAQQDAIVYEAHVRGLTRHESSSNLVSLLSGVSGFESVANVPVEYRGTYKGAALMAPYLKALGINTIELLPVHETANDINPDNGAGGNFWGYMTYGYFAPDRRYSADKTLGGPTREFKQMVKTFHDNGIEVYLDVVYNHSGEGGNWDATKTAAELTSFRGLDNQVYYALVSNDKASYWETTGCGNNMNVGHPAVANMVKDSLKYFISEMGIDGFRFDLATVLGRDSAPNYYYNPNAQLLNDIAAMTTAYNVEMIAEAWDIGAYGVGTFPNRWGEWNGRYRDASRRFMKGDASGAGGISYADAFYGDFANFNDQGGAMKSVNFIVAHDGFTLADLVSYNTKTNTARVWPFGTSDGGSDNNDSWNSDGNQSLRRQRMRNLFVWQMFSRGVPMIVYGDEFGRTQNGNNNPYNLDSVATWNNYAQIASDSPQAVATGYSGEAYHNNFGTDLALDGKNAIFLFNKYVMNLRKSAPALRQGNYSMPIAFAKADGSGGFNAYGDRAVRIHLDGSAVGDSDYLMFVNMWTSQVSFTAPTPDAGKRWVRIIDTAAWAESNNNFWSEAAAWTLSGAYGVNPWSIVVFKAVGDSPVLSGDANLNALTVSAGALTPAFASGTTAYSLSTTALTSNVTATRSHSAATLQYQVNGGTWTTLASGTSSAAFNLVLGLNTVNVRVTAENGTVKTYTVSVTRTAGGLLPNGTLRIIMKSNAQAQSVKFPGDFNGWNINTTNAIAVAANGTVTLDIANAVTAANLAGGNSTTALELQVINNPGSWTNAWWFNSWTKSGCSVGADNKQILIPATANDVVTLTIDVAAGKITAVVEAR